MAAGGEAGRAALAAGAFGALAAALLAAARRRAAERDPWRWLEEADSPRALRWVAERAAEVPFSGTGPLFARLSAALGSKDKLPLVERINDHYYNFWTDDDHQRGIWRRTTIDDFCKPNTQWHTVLDVDALCRAENEEWVWWDLVVPKLPPGTRVQTVLICLSQGGSDAVEVREFDLATETFLPTANHPFNVRVAKTSVAFKDADTVLIGSDFGPGSLTTSGYPRQIKEWFRGQALADANIVFEGNASDPFVRFRCERQPGGIEYEIIEQYQNFFVANRFVRAVRGIDAVTMTPGSPPIRLVIPGDALIDVFCDQFLISLRSDWMGFVSGSLIAAPAVKVLAARSPSALAPGDFALLFRPEPHLSLRDYSLAKTKSYLIVGILDNVKSKLETWKYSAGTWKRASGPTLIGGSGASISTMSCWPVDPLVSDQVWIKQESFVQPKSLFLAVASNAEPPKLVKQESHLYDSHNVQISQHFATSLDGTKVPYFVVAKRGEPGPRPTLMYGYGGFKIARPSEYDAIIGAGWIQSGHTYVCANIRGGGEFGPEWHRAALREKRHKAFEDFEAVAQDLVRRGFTTRQQLGCIGASNGGLLMGNMLTRSPTLFGAIVIQVPLLDMKRYNKLLAGASWMAEFGNPDTSDWSFLRRFSPYHNVDPSRAEEYPPVMLTTNTRDDRVHPSHARKMAARLREVGARYVVYCENTEGGHGGASTGEQEAQLWTKIFQFLEQALVTV